MGRRLRRPILFCALALASAARAETPAERGAYLVRAGGCVSCHTDEKGGGAPFSGGVALKTPFGVFYSPNITPDAQTGVGGWSDRQFLDALKHGRRPDGAAYYPAFPYTTYARMTDADALAIKAYLDSLPPVMKRDRPHELRFPFGWRWTVSLWQALFFEPGEFRENPARSAEWNRGAYLVEALAHCGECHTPRNALGALDRDLWLAGTPDGPEGEVAPNITPDPKTGIGSWSEADIVTLLKEGVTPEYDNVQGTMAKAVRDGLSHLTDADLQTIAVYLKSVPPVEHQVRRR
jgi:mono/diheme cytochrome c family protein